MSASTTGRKIRQLFGKDLSCWSNHMNSQNNPTMKKKKSRTVTASDHDHADGAALTLLFGNEHILLHLSLFVVLPLPYLCKACAQQGGSSFTSAHVYALSCHENHRKWASCRFSEGERTPQLLRLREKPQPQHQRGKREKGRMDRRIKENPAPLLVSPHKMVRS